MLISGEKTTKKKDLISLLRDRGYCSAVQSFWYFTWLSAVFLFAGGVVVFAETTPREQETPLPDFESEALRQFQKGEGPALSRESVGEILFSLYEGQELRGSAVRIADSFFITARHVLGADPSHLQLRHVSMPDREAATFTVLAVDRENDIALLYAHLPPANVGGSAVRLAHGNPKPDDPVSLFYPLKRKATRNYYEELKGNLPFEPESDEASFKIGRLILPRGSSVYEVQGISLSFKTEQVQAYLSKSNLPHGFSLPQPENQGLTTLVGQNGASGTGVFKMYDTGHELVGIVIGSLSDTRLIDIPRSPLGYTKLQQNYTIYTRIETVRRLIEKVLKAENGAP